MELILERIIKDNEHQPVVQRTIFGWILSGPIYLHEFPQPFSEYHCLTDNEHHSYTILDSKGSTFEEGCITYFRVRQFAKIISYLRTLGMSQAAMSSVYPLKKILLL